MLEILKSGSQGLEKEIDELIIVYTQPQPAYMEMAALVPKTQMIKLGSKLDLKEFLEILGDDKTKTRGIIFDDVNYFVGLSLLAIDLLSFGGGTVQCCGDLASHT